MQTPCRGAINIGVLLFVHEFDADASQEGAFAGCRDVLCLDVPCSTLQLRKLLEEARSLDQQPSDEDLDLVERKSDDKQIVFEK